MPERITPRHLHHFRDTLVAWFRRSHRSMPWRATRDPYHIWVSEVMLQQTRVDQATPYFLRWIQRFPDVVALAAAELDEVLRYWEGLGYYARARNLHRAARAVVEQHGGHVPEGYEAFRALPGVGPYTAAAVLSIAHELPHAVLDGNVSRVLTRVFTIGDDVKKPATQRTLQHLADALLAPQHPGDFNQALMELGATICMPLTPKCPACPLQNVCGAWREGAPLAYPVTTPKRPVPHHDIAVGIVSDAEGRFLLQRRPEDGLLGGLWEFPGGKVLPGETPEAACRRELQEELGIEVEIGAPLPRLAHAYTHFRITLHPFRCRLSGGKPVSSAGLSLAWASADALDDYAFPRANRRLIEALRAETRAPSLFE